MKEPRSITGELMGDGGGAPYLRPLWDTGGGVRVQVAVSDHQTDQSCDQQGWQQVYSQNKETG